jgi:hypothetical protein
VALSACHHIFEETLAAPKRWGSRLTADLHGTAAQSPSISPSVFE